MLTEMNAEDCHARARVLKATAWAACDYDSMLLYEELAQEWMNLARLMAQRERGGDPHHGLARRT